MKINRLLKVLFGASVVGLCGTAYGQEKPEHKIYEDTPRTGSKIRNAQVGPMAVPVNLRYEDLSESDKNVLRSRYEDMPVTDEPPFPLDGLSSVLKPIRDAQDQMLLTGRLHAVATVGVDGMTSQVQIIEAPSKEMAKFIGQLLMLTKFRPASCNGSPCVMEFPIDLRFTIN